MNGSRAEDESKSKSSQLRETTRVSKMSVSGPRRESTVRQKQLKVVVGMFGWGAAAKPAAVLAEPNPSSPSAP